MTGYRIILAGKVAAGLTSRLLNDESEAFTARFPKHFLKQAVKKAEAAGDAGEIIAIVGEQPEVVIEPVGSDGVLGALWRLGEKTGCGLMTDFDAIPIEQEFIEICNFADADPYTGDDEGCVLAAADEDITGRIVSRLHEQGFDAGEIGVLTNECARVIMRGDKRVFINQPRR